MIFSFAKLTASQSLVGFGGIGGLGIGGLGIGGLGIHFSSQLLVEYIPAFPPSMHDPLMQL
jgi:hypothetical protein